MTQTAELALFDLDHTLIPFDSSQEWGRFMVQHGLAAPEFSRQLDWFQDEYVAGRLDMNAYLEYFSSPLANFSRSELDGWHACFMQEVVEPQIAPAARELVQSHLRAGHLCCIVTATIDFVTRPIARAFGVEHLLAIELVTKDDGRYTGAWTGIPTFREGKVTRTEAWLQSLGHDWGSFSTIHFYSDSFNDMPLLRYASRPVATNPDKPLREYAQAHGWVVLDLPGH